MDGFVNSQTWEAWFESYEVLWDNTSYIFVISVLLSVVIAVATYLMPIGSQELHSSERKVEDDEDIREESEEKDLGSKILEEKRHVDLKNAQRRALERSMENQLTAEQREAEREAQSQQLAAIFKMMQEQEEKFGKTSIDDIKDQMKLYCG
ncbi:matrix-remodeling-associated protein 7-like isoform X2 [Macrobrachium nipponense]|uniref:matrix-remodeling-associated protein 7-like isoform X2 n=1 Tax=Macrobrachium nipponense TaxID=159736 RepID=UPI0030C8D134